MKLNWLVAKFMILVCSKFLFLLDLTFILTYEIKSPNRFLVILENSICNSVPMSYLDYQPFNLQLDFWKWRSWEIKYFFKPKKKFRSCTPGFFFSLSPGSFSGLWYKSSFFLGLQVCSTWKVWSRTWFFKTLISRNQGAD